MKADPIFADLIPRDAAEAVRMMLGQLPIVFALRAGGELRIPIEEVDGTGQHILDLSIEGDEFVFRVSKKS